MTHDSYGETRNECDIDSIVMRIKGEHRRCRMFIRGGSYDRAAEALRDSRRHLGTLLSVADLANKRHCTIVKEIGAQHAACAGLVCAARCIQADEALLQMRTLYQEREAARDDAATVVQRDQRASTGGTPSIPTGSRGRRRQKHIDLLPGHT